MLGNLPILAIIVICYQEKIVKHGEHEDQILQLTEQFCGNKKKSPPPKNSCPMSLIWVIGKVKKKADVSGQSDRGLADDALTSLLRSRARPPPY